MIRDRKIQELRILGVGLGAEIGAAVILELNHTTYFPIHDHRGSLVTLIPLRKAPIPYRYSAFGEQLTPNTLSPWRFSSKRHDAETGFVYFGRRYYSPPLGRWITTDPQGFKDGPNLYAYLKNSPLLSIDLYGERAQNTSARQDCRDFWHRMEGAGHVLRDWACNALSRIGGWAWSSSGTNILETDSFQGEWQTLSWKNPSDRLSLAYRTFLPYSYDLQHLPSSISSENRLRAEGAAAFEKFMYVYSAAKVAQGAASASFPTAAKSQETITSLTSRECTYSGMPGTPKDGLQKMSSANLVIKETLSGSGDITSKFKISANEALEAGMQFLGSNYKELGRSGSGVFRSSDGLRQFRIDSNSLLGEHSPWDPHVHFEAFEPKMNDPYVNNHVFFYE